MTYNAYKLLTKYTLKPTEDDCVFYKYKNFISKYKLPKENKTKIIIYLNVLPESIICDTDFINKINKSNHLTIHDGIYILTKFMHYIYNILIIL